MAGEMTLGALIVRVLMDASKYDSEAKKVQATTVDLGKMFKRTSDVIGGLFVKAAKGATVAAAGLAAASAVVGANFEVAMSKVAAVKGIDKTSQAFKALEEEARRLGATTNFSASQAAAGMEELARAGLEVDEIISASQSTLEMAAGSSISLADAASIVAATMAQFSMEADETSRITDVLTAATQGSLFAMEDLREAMKMGGTTGSALGMTLEETTAALAQFRNLGLEGSMAGTNFRGAMTALAAPTAAARDALKDLGLTTADVSPEVNSFKEIMVKLGESGMGVVEASAIFGRKFGNNVTKIASGMATSSQDFDDLMGKLMEAEGTTTSTYGIMTDNVMGSLDQLKSAAEEVMIGLFQTYGGPLATLLDSVTTLARKVGQEIGLASKEIGGGFAETLKRVSDFIDSNSSGWAKQIASIIRGAADFGNTLSTVIIPLLDRLLPLVDDIAIVMGTIWAVQKIMAFVQILAALPAAIATVTAAIKAMGVALAVSTGGLTAILAAITVVIAGLFLLAKRNRDAAAATRELALQQELAAERARSATMVLDGATRALVQSQKERLITERESLDLSTKAGTARAIEIDQFLDMDEATATLMVRRGELLKVGEDLVTVESLVASGTDESRLQILKAIKGTEKFIEAREEERKSTAGSADEVERLTDVIGEHRKKLLALRRALVGKVAEDQTASAAADLEAAALERKTKALGGAEEGTKELAEATGELPPIYREATMTLGTTIEPMGRFVGVAIEGTESLSDFSEEIAKLSAEAQKLEMGRDGGTLKEGMGVVKAAGSVVTGMVTGVVGLIGAIGDAGSFVAGLPDLMGGILDGFKSLPKVLEDLGAKLPKLIRTFVVGIARAIPKIVKAIVEAIPGIIRAIVDVLPVLINGLIEALVTVLNALPEIITTVFEALPSIVTTILEALPVIIKAIILALPDIIISLIDGIIGALPDIIGALVLLVPQLIAALISSIPQLVFTLGKYLLIELPITLVKMIPQLASTIGKAILQGFKEIFEAIKEFFKKLWPFGKNDEGKNKSLFGFLRKKDGSAYSGIDYVPSAMRIDVHPGEAVIPADRNRGGTTDTTAAAGAFAGGNASRGGGGGGGGPSSVEVAVIVDGSMLDKVQATSDRRGGSYRIARERRRAGDVKVGIKRGKFNPFT